MPDQKPKQNMVERPEQITNQKIEQEKTPEQMRTERITTLDRALNHYKGPKSDHELESRAEELRQQYAHATKAIELPDEKRQQLDEKMNGEIASTQESMVRYQEQRQEGQVLKAQELIGLAGGNIDSDKKPYKQFNPKKHERFLIQKGKFHDSEAVFKVGESGDKETIQNESRNLRVIEHASITPAAKLDVHFVRQLGDVFENDRMSGLATEYIQDDPELKRNLTSEQKVEVIEKTIENLQRLTVTDEARESGLSSHTGEKIVRDAQYFLDTLSQEDRIDSNTVRTLQETFRNALPALVAERPVFVHGDAHGDNIFIKKTDSGEIDISLLDFEGLRISNQYHDWSEILNKSAFLKHLQSSRPELFEPIKSNVENMWLDESVKFDEQQIIGKVTGGNSDKARNFRLTRTYDMLTRIMNDRNSTHPIAQERVKLYLEQLQNEAQKTY